MIMIDLLLINPPGHIHSVLPVFKSQKLDCKIIVTPESGEHAKFVLEEERVTLESIEEVTTALSWGPRGQRVVEQLDSAKKIKLGNINSPVHSQRRLETYYKEQPLGPNSWVFELVSFRGRHVLSYARFNDPIGSFHDPKPGWRLISHQEQNFPFFTEKVEEVFEYIDAIGGLSGPFQVYIDHESNFSYKGCFGNHPRADSGAAIPMQQRHRHLFDGLEKKFGDIWPTVLLNLKNNMDKNAIQVFYEWANSKGSTKKFGFKASSLFL